LRPASREWESFAIPDRSNTEDDTRYLLDAGGTLGQQVLVLNARNDGELETAFATFARRRVGGVVIGSAVFFNQRRAHLAELATRHVLPTISPNRDHAISGGLLSYGTSLEFTYRRAGVYVGRILKGEKPADLPVEQTTTKIELIINLKTAKALGLTIPPNLLAIADEVIE
jgi:putative tryptophan/tyrosine transport system substrate-binding protein